MATAEYWLCRCGAYNALHVDKCPSCGFEKSSRQTFTDVPGADDEGKLHDEIEKYCRDRRWAYVHARRDRATTCNRGVADFVIFPPSPHVIILELKRKDGKQRPEQLAWQCVVENQGHVYHIARSMDDFKAILRDKNLL